MSPVISYLERNPIFGEDARKMQMIDHNIADRPSTQGMQKLPIERITIGKKQNLPLQGAASKHLMKQLLGIFYRFLGDTS